MSVIRRPTHLYDAVVVGGDLAGLVAGALLTKRGARVLVAPAGEAAGHEVGNGYRLPTRPSLLPSPKNLPSLHALLDELGLMPTVGRAIAPHPGGLQLLLQDARLDWAQEPKARRAELVRAFGEGAQAWEANLFAGDLPITTWLQAAAKLPTLGLRETFSLRKPAKALRRFAAEARELGRLGEPLQALTHLLSLSDGGRVGAARVLLPLLAQPSGIPGSSLVDELRAYILSKRGELIEAPVEEVVVERGAFVGVRFQGLSEPHRGNLALAALHPGRLQGLIDEQRLQRKLEQVAAPWDAASRLHTHHWVARKEALPPGLGAMALLLGPAGPPTLLGVEPARLQDGAPAPDRLVFTATASLPADRDAAAGADAIRAQVEALLPFLQQHVEHEQHLLGGPAEVRHPSRGALGVEGLPLRSPIRHLLWTSRYVLPGLGLEGELLTGLRAADASDELRRKG